MCCCRFAPATASLLVQPHHECLELDNFRPENVECRSVELCLVGSVLIVDHGYGPGDGTERVQHVNEVRTLGERSEATSKVVKAKREGSEEESMLDMALAVAETPGPPPQPSFYPLPSSPHPVAVRWPPSSPSR